MKSPIILQEVDIKNPPRPEFALCRGGRSPHRNFLRILDYLVCDNRQKQKRDDICNLNHRVHGWASGIFIRIANCIAGY